MTKKVGAEEGESVDQPRISTGSDGLDDILERSAASACAHHDG
jgi:hypothetical protein